MGLTETILLIVVLVLAAMALIVAEVCTPSFGLLAALAIGCVAWAVYLCYGITGALGIAATVIAIFGLPAYAVAAVKVIPRTALGRAMFLKRRVASRPGRSGTRDELNALVGRTTTADTVLRPSGFIRIDDKRINARAESGMIGKGRAVKIIAAAGKHVIVREANS